MAYLHLSPSVPASGPQLLLPAPRTVGEPPPQRPVVDIQDVLAASGAEDNDASLPFVFVDEFHLLLHTFVAGVSGPGKPLSASWRASGERQATKRVTLSGDDDVLAEWEAESDLDWTVLWQSWVPPTPGIALARVQLLEESEAGLQLAVDVGMTCEELARELGNRFPTLSVEVVAQPARNGHA